ncbi:MAG: hypothetical protein ABL890_01170 [Candidatus Peribacteraceae bacterium]
MHSRERRDDECTGRDSSPGSKYDALADSQRFIMDGKMCIKINDRSYMNEFGEVLDISEMLEKCISLDAVTEEDSSEDHALEKDPDGEGNPYYLTYVDLEVGRVFTLASQPGYIFVKQNNRICVGVAIDENGKFDEFGEGFRAVDICVESINMWGDAQLLGDDGDDNVEEEPSSANFAIRSDHIPLPSNRYTQPVISTTRRSLIEQLEDVHLRRN